MRLGVGGVWGARLGFVFRVADSSLRSRLSMC